MRNRNHKALDHGVAIIMVIVVLAGLLALAAPFVFSMISHSRLARSDLHALDLSIKFFNTYLRATLNASDIRTAYNILHQYRQLGEFVLSFGRNFPSDQREPLEHRALQIARFMR